MVVLMTTMTLISTAQDDFGYDLSVAGETKLATGLKLEFEGSMRTQDDAERIDRYVLGVGLSYRLYQNTTKTLNVKANLGFDYLWLNKLEEIENKYFDAEDANDDLVKGGYFKIGDNKGYNVTDQYWRNRYRINPGIQVNYAPNKRWEFVLKETVQYSHYCKATTNRTKWRYDEYNSEELSDGRINWILSPYEYDDDLYVDEKTFDANGNVVGKRLDQSEDTKNPKDRTMLRSKLTVSYDIKNIPIDLFASVEYGCGLNYSAHKWKYTVGYDYKINKKNKLSLYYRYNTENDDDEVNGHLVGLGYKVDF